MSESVSIIIVNWNAGKQLAAVVSSISKYHHGLVSSVIIVDNASHDDSLAQVEVLENIPFQLQIVRNSDNRGFGAACNQGATLATSEYFLFLNPDTRLFENSLSVPVAFMDDEVNQNVGVVGIQLMDEQDNIARHCARFPTLKIFMAQSLGLSRLPAFSQLSAHMSDWAHDETRIVNHVIGAFYMMRRSIFNSLGGFDEQFFVYYEDLDLSFRVHKAGYRSIYLTNARAFHAGNGTTRQIKAHRLFYSLRSRILYGFKHFSPWQAWGVMAITLGIEPVTRSVFALKNEGIDGVKNTWGAYGMLWRWLQKWLQKKEIE